MLRVWLGDCKVRLQEVPGKSINVVVCDPPYGLEFLGVEWDSLGPNKELGGNPQLRNHRRVMVEAPETESGRPWASERPSYGVPKKNPRCRACGKLKFTRETSRCSCAAPDWDTRGYEYARTMGKWHEGWLFEVFRVLKHRGVIKAFSGTRTGHRLAMAMEAAGFEGVHLEAWSYASGFPKSLAVDKALDKRPNAHLHHLHIKEMLKEAIRASGKTRADIDAECGFHACDFARTEGSSPYVRVLPSQERWAVMREVLGVKDDTLTSALADAEREVIGTGACGKTAIWSNDLSGSFEITTPATCAARSWHGWGTAFKPAWEPVLVGTKP